MHRVVLDTNVIISSTFWKSGNPHKIVSLAIGQKIQNFTSRNMVNELVKVLIVDFRQPDQFVERQVNLLLAYSEIIEPKIKANAVPEDPKDNMILAVALSGKADFLVTGDKDILAVNLMADCQILTPVKFLGQLQR